jgi:hypothetical protein
MDVRALMLNFHDRLLALEENALAQRDRPRRRGDIDADVQRIRALQHSASVLIRGLGWAEHADSDEDDSDAGDALRRALHGHLSSDSDSDARVHASAPVRRSASADSDADAPLPGFFEDSDDTDGSDGHHAAPPRPAPRPVVSSPIASSLRRATSQASEEAAARAASLFDTDDEDDDGDEAGSSVPYAVRRTSDRNGSGIAGRIPAAAAPAATVPRQEPFWSRLFSSRPQHDGLPI